MCGIFTDDFPLNLEFCGMLLQLIMTNDGSHSVAAGKKRIFAREAGQIVCFDA
jgi:hypothetical protein